VSVKRKTALRLAVFRRGPLGIAWRAVGESRDVDGPAPNRQTARYGDREGRVVSDGDVCRDMDLEDDEANRAAETLDDARPLQSGPEKEKA